MLDFPKGWGNGRAGKCVAYVRERERIVSCGECVDGEKGGLKLEWFVGKANWGTKSGSGPRHFLGRLFGLGLGLVFSVHFGLGLGLGKWEMSNRVRGERRALRGA